MQGGAYRARHKFVFNFSTDALLLLVICPQLLSEPKFAKVSETYRRHLIFPIRRYRACCLLNAHRNTVIGCGDGAITFTPLHRMIQAAITLRFIDLCHGYACLIIAVFAPKFLH